LRYLAITAPSSERKEFAQLDNSSILTFYELSLHQLQLKQNPQGSLTP
jgi:hypothetical protein